MQTNLFILDAIIRKVCPDKLDKLVSYLDEKESYEEISFSKTTFNKKDFSYDEYFKEIHYSWWIEPLKMTSSDINYFLAVLPEETKTPLEKILKPTKKTITLTEDLEYYLKKTLLHTLKNIALPPAYLPKSLMHPLLSLSKKQLISLIDYLSLYDLGFELKHIVDTNIIKPVFSHLDAKESAFLKRVMKTRETFSFPRIHLERWDKEEKSLRAHLHKKGIFRLAVALSCENKDLLWHITHRLDVGRGTMLKKAIKKEISSSIIDTIQANIIELIEEDHF